MRRAYQSDLAPHPEHAADGCRPLAHGRRVLQRDVLVVQQHNCTRESGEIRQEVNM